MELLTLTQILLLAVIAAGPEDTAPAAILGLAALFMGTIMYGTPTLQVFGLTVIGVILFGTRALTRLFTGYGAPVRKPPASENETNWEDRRR